jgi:hypothetical protein
MAQMLLVNPAKRRKARKARRKNPSAAQRRAWAKLGAMARSRSRKARAGSRKRRSAPAVQVFANPRKRRTSRRRNPVMTYRRRRSARRSNPISVGGLFNLRSYINPLKDAAIMGGGAIAVDMVFARFINPYLPARVQVVPGSVGVGDLVKAMLTVALGRVLAKPTRGLSTKAAMGSLVVQMRDVALKALPPSVTGQVAGLGFMNPARVVPQMRRTNTNALPRNSMGVITTGATPLLSGVGQISTGRSPLLSGLARHGR